MAEGEELLAWKGLIARKVGAARFHQCPRRGVVGDLVYAVRMGAGREQIRKRREKRHEQRAQDIYPRCVVPTARRLDERLCHWSTSGVVEG